MVEAIDIACEGRVAEWFKAAVLKTAVAPARKLADFRKDAVKSMPFGGALDANFARFRENKSGLPPHNNRHSLFALSPRPLFRGAA